MPFPCCLSVCESLPINFWMSEPIFMKLGMYNMTIEPISTTYFTHPSHQSGSVLVSLIWSLGKDSVWDIPPFIVRQRLGKHVIAAMNIRNNTRIVGRVCLWVCLFIPLSLLDNNSVEAFPRQWRIGGAVIFYAVRVVQKKNFSFTVVLLPCLNTELMDNFNWTVNMVQATEVLFSYKKQIINSPAHL
jgi:hypothetical protein